ncbi:hypothetical protein [uncultured Brevundimonas sp.]|uniref:hypothetical protein n=1 Tax=uncultured Brevundimonas sp. TaxID=213418 RepID=UPI002593D0BF|nr:hypothetical protein [uncultured Brevundimonas sp.]
MTKRSKTSDDTNTPAVLVTETAPAGKARRIGPQVLDKVKSSLQSGSDQTRAAAAVAGHGMVIAVDAVKKAADATARASGELGVAAYYAVGDLNGDGKVDEDDWKIARHAAGKAAAGIAREAGELGKAVARHEITKDAAAGAAVGALIALPIPFVGPAAGAAAGAAIGLTRGVLDSGAIADVVGQAAAAVRKPPTRKPARKQPRR